MPLRARTALLSLLLSLFAVAALAQPPPAANTHSERRPPAGLIALLSTLDQDYPAVSTGPPAPAALSEDEQAREDERLEAEALAEARTDQETAHKEWLNDVIADAEDLISRNADYKTAIKRFRLAAVLGHEGAAATAGALLLAADGSLQRDISAAVGSLRRAANEGQPDAHALLGVLHASGLADRHGVQKSLQRALVHWTVAAGSGNVYASSALGFRHMYGLGVPRDCEVAALYYRKAASAIATDPRYWPTAHNFAHGEAPLASSLVSVGRTRFSEDSFRRATQTNSEDLDLFYYYRHSAEGGDTNSMTLIGSLLLTGGLGMDADVNQARHHLRRAAAEGHGEAHGLMGHLAMRQSNYTGAMYHFRHSAAKGDRIGHYGLGMIFLHGLAGQKKDFSKAAMHFTLAAEVKHADASFQLAMLHWRGDGVKLSWETAYRLFQDSAKLGSIQSKLNLGLILLEGHQPAPQKDCPRAVQYFKEVAEEGEWGTLFDLALGAFDKGDMYGSLYRHTQAAHAGIELGQFNAAMILELSEEKDIPELAHWSRARRIQELHELYDMSGVQGKSESYLRSGDVAYIESQDFKTAANAYNNSRLLENAEGTFSLAMMYANGIGVSMDRDQAMEHLETVSEMESSGAIAAHLAMAGLRVFWCLDDVRDWWRWLREVRDEGVAGEGGNAQLEDMSGPGSGVRRSAEAKNKLRSSIGEDLALVGGLLVVLIAVLVVRTKRMARQPSGEVGVGSR